MYHFWPHLLSKIQFICISHPSRKHSNGEPVVLIEECPLSVLSGNDNRCCESHLDENLGDFLGKKDDPIINSLIQ